MRTLPTLMLLTLLNGSIFALDQSDVKITWAADEAKGLVCELTYENEGIRILFRKKDSGSFMHDMLSIDKDAADPLAKELATVEAKFTELAKSGEEASTQSEVAGLHVQYRLSKKHGPTVVISNNPFNSFGITKAESTKLSAMLGRLPDKMREFQKFIDKAFAK